MLNVHTFVLQLDRTETTAKAINCDHNDLIICNIVLFEVYFTVCEADHAENISRRKKSFPMKLCVYNVDSELYRKTFTYQIYHYMLAPTNIVHNYFN